jgi:hypothetical protein
MPFVCSQISNFPKGVGTAYEEGDPDWLFLICFEELVKTYATPDLVEDFCGAKVFPIRVGWTMVAWRDFTSPIKIPNFSWSLKLEAMGVLTYLDFVHFFACLVCFLVWFLL